MPGSDRVGFNEPYFEKFYGVFVEHKGFSEQPTLLTLVHLETETQAQEGRQIVVLSPLANTRFLLEIHMITPPRETSCTTLGFFLLD